VVEQVYAYRRPSAVGTDRGVPHLALATSGSLVGASHPWLFSGELARPRMVARALLMVAEVARTRYYTPPNMIAAAIRAADPVVTADGDRLRFESFSQCRGVYARLDLGSKLLGAGFQAHGTTNVDFNQPMRAALAALGDSESMHLDVGWDSVRVTTPQSQVVERKVKLPPRWVKGFAEVTLAAAAMVPYHELDVAAARAFLRTLPRVPTREAMWATPAGSGLRLAGRADARAVCLAAPERLALLQRLLPFTHALRAFGRVSAAPREPEPSAWQLCLGDASLTLVLSPAYNRGFSGEGEVLSSLDAIDGDTVELVADAIDVGNVDPEGVAGLLGVARDVAWRALTVLAASGRVGYDLGSGTYFHRELPFDREALAALHPRLRGARKLVEQAAIEQIDAVETVVTSGGVDYVVRSSPDGWRCTCPWFSKYQGMRGPCKHVLAAQASRRNA
jgi:hypothetical protein